MVKKIEPVAIPAICNEKEALMRYLNLDSEDDEVRDQVKLVGEFKVTSARALWPLRVLIFKFGDAQYHVSTGTSDIEADVIVEFNSGLWRIKKCSALTLSEG